MPSGAAQGPESVINWFAGRRSLSSPSRPLPPQALWRWWAGCAFSVVPRVQASNAMADLGL